MDNMLISIANTIKIVESDAVTVNASNDSPLGYIVIGLIAIPVLVLLLASLFGKPKSTKITLLFLGWLLMIFCVFIIAVFGLSFLTSFFY